MQLSEVVEYHYRPRRQHDQRRLNLLPYRPWLHLRFLLQYHQLLHRKDVRRSCLRLVEMRTTRPRFVESSQSPICDRV